MLRKKLAAAQLQRRMQEQEMALAGKGNVDEPAAENRSPNTAVCPDSIAQKIAVDAKLDVEKPKRGDDAIMTGASIGEHDSAYDMFRTEFHRGLDFVYGMSRPRAEYIRKALGGEALALSGVPTVDMQNRYIVPENPIDAKTDLSMTDGKVKEYHDFLSTHESEKYRSLAQYRERIASNDMKAKHKRTKYITRSCKAKIEETVSKGNQIHFVLDDGNHGWEMEAVVKKEGVAGNLITAKELRHVYKNKDKVINQHLLSSHVTFWRKGQKVQAPWVENPELWDGFVRKGSKK
ncbi:hypothetical protein AQUSIP_17980 [Aquicella siphonis]|uniref:Uncharacterized protein n=1 Tax=Aquicella siphonis TaxID=254247 RepID=A0A5E4PIT8_9COXI|nr:hypothetical protein [Aquicella siphonis]VVC76485.1 hypothetical protein AQUSIP_17980 [Aquicella siphonis]